tara:strand:- start:1213 stop:2373 length:1161 start_codon:yes stop_codon:yes gene_type:complete
MKFIGQFIQDFIARFRNDVYLEDVSTGTIESGGNLGLDSNNKIVKNTVSGSSEFTLTGDSGSDQEIASGNTLTISGGNAISTTVSATDTLRVDHDDTSSQASVNNSGRTFIQDITLDTYGHVTGITSATDSDTHSGDITAVNITTDSGGGEARVAVASGDADFSILGTSGVGVTNSGAEITVTSVPGEIDHDSLLNFTANEHFTQANITTVGTIGTGVWQGTAIATDQQKHLAWFRVTGNSTGDGTNYEMSVNLDNDDAPWLHNVSIGSAGTTATTVQNMIRSGGRVMPRAGTVKRWTGWATTAGSSTVDIALFKMTPARNNNTDVAPVLIQNTSYSALGNAKAEDFDETSFTDADLAAGDILISGIKCQNNKATYFTSTVEIEWD